MPSWKKVILSGSNAELNEITASSIRVAAGELTPGAGSQNTFFTVSASNASVDATSTTDKIIFEAGDGIFISASADTDTAKLFISSSGGTGTGDVTKKLFAGSGSTSQEDWVLNLLSGNPSASDGQIVIETSVANSFIPNHYTFSILTASGWKRLQSGSEPSFSVPDNSASIDEPKQTEVGEHVYLITATDSGSKETHDIFTTNTIKAFVNSPPVTTAGNNITASMSHDSNTTEVYFYATESYEPDTAGGDKLTKWTFDRDTNPASTGGDSFTFTMKNPDGGTTSGQTLTYTNTDGIPPGSLIFTGSITAYNFSAPDDNQREVKFNLTLEDANTAEASSSVTMSFVPPPTASIKNLRIEVENGAGTETPTTTYTTKLLYGDTTTRNDFTGLNTDTTSQFSESLVRVRCCADIEEPDGYSPGGSHQTIVRVVDNGSSRTWKYFKFEHGEKTASGFGDIYNASPWTSTGSDGFVFFGEKSTGAYTLKAYSATDGIWHGTHDHYSASLGANCTININNHDNTQVSWSIEIEEDYSGSNVGTHNTRTTKILHGSPTTSINHSEGVNLGSKEQLVSMRLLADVKEPFGPFHTSSNFSVTTNILNDRTFVFYTGSNDASSSMSLDYTTHGSQSVSYTSSWYPIKLNEGNNQDIDVGTITHNFGSHQTKEIDDGRVTVLPPDTSSISVNPISSSDFTASSADYPFIHLGYYGSNDLANEIRAGHTYILPPTRSITELTTTDFKVTWSRIAGEDDYNDIYTPTASFDLTTGVASAYTTQTYHRVRCSVTNSVIDGQDLGSGSGDFEFYVLPREAESFHNSYFSDDGDLDSTSDGRSYNGHKIVSTYGDVGAYIPAPHSTKRIYKADLSEKLLPLKTGDSAGTTVANVIMARNTGNSETDYSMSFKTTTGTTGNQSSDIYNYGDTGSLIVKLNDEVVASASLQEPFVKTSNSGSQFVENYNTGNWTNGTASFTNTSGSLIIDSVQPYNNFSGSINGFPNGYQGWSATIQINDKIREGYNKLEFSHSIDGTTTHSITNEFDWYYDDDFVEPQLQGGTDPTMSLVQVGEITHSLSGVSFFKYRPSSDQRFKYVKGTLANNKILDLASNTFRQQTDGNKYVLKTDIVHGPAHVTTGSTSTTDDDYLHHTLDSTANSNGLTFDEASSPLIPTTSSKASVNNLKFFIDGDLTNPTDGLGTTPLVKFSAYERDFNEDDGWSVDTNNTLTTGLGRWVNSSSLTPVADSDTEDFVTEDFRWTSKSIADSASLNPSSMDGTDKNYTFWLSSSRADWDSVSNISESEDLQQTYEGRLLYPTINYNVSASYDTQYPNIVNYSNASGSGDRYYYRAFKISSNTGTVLTVDSLPQTIGGFQTSSIWNLDVNWDALPVRIDVKLPGPVSTDAGVNSENNPGSGWLVATANETQNLNSPTGDKRYDLTTSCVLGSMSYDDDNGTMTFELNFGNYEADNTDRVILLRAVFRDPTTYGEITASETFLDSISVT